MTSPTTSNHLFQRGDLSPYCEFGWLGFMCLFGFEFCLLMHTNHQLNYETGSSIFGILRQAPQAALVGFELVILTALLQVGVTTLG